MVARWLEPGIPSLKQGSLALAGAVLAALFGVLRRGRTRCSARVHTVYLRDQDLSLVGFAELA